MNGLISTKLLHFKKCKPPCKRLRPFLKIDIFCKIKALTRA